MKEVDKTGSSWKTNHLMTSLKVLSDAFWQSASAPVNKSSFKWHVDSCPCCYFVTSEPENRISQIWRTDGRADETPSHRNARRHVGITASFITCAYFHVTCSCCIDGGGGGGGGGFSPSSAPVCLTRWLTHFLVSFLSPRHRYPWLCGGGSAQTRSRHDTTSTRNWKNEDCHSYEDVYLI